MMMVMMMMMRKIRFVIHERKKLLFGSGFRTLMGKWGQDIWPHLRVP